MDKRTAEALEASIAKWEKNSRVRKLENAKMGPSECPLCVLFYDDNCRGCPVRDAGHFQCARSPYDDAESAYSDGDIVGFRAHAEAEVSFLKGFRDA